MISPLLPTVEELLERIDRLDSLPVASKDELQAILRGTLVVIKLIIEASVDGRTMVE